MMKGMTDPSHNRKGSGRRERNEWNEMKKEKGKRK